MKIQAPWYPGMPRTSNLWQALSINEFMGHSQSVFWWPNSKSHDPGSGVGTWLLLANTLCQLWIYYLGWKDKRGNWFFVWTRGIRSGVAHEVSRGRRGQNTEFSLMGFSSQVALVSWWSHTSMLLIAAFDLPLSPEMLLSHFLGSQRSQWKPCVSMATPAASLGLQKHSLQRLS